MQIKYDLIRQSTLLLLILGTFMFPLNSDNIISAKLSYCLHNYITTEIAMFSLQLKCSALEVLLTILATFSSCDHEP